MMHAARCTLQTANCKPLPTGVQVLDYSVLHYSSIPVFQYWWLNEAWVFQMLASLSLSFAYAE